MISCNMSAVISTRGGPSDRSRSEPSSTSPSKPRRWPSDARPARRGPRRAWRSERRRCQKRRRSWSPRRDDHAADQERERSPRLGHGNDATTCWSAGALGEMRLYGAAVFACRPYRLLWLPLGRDEEELARARRTRSGTGPGADSPLSSATTYVSVVVGRRVHPRFDREVSAGTGTSPHPRRTSRCCRTGASTDRPALRRSRSSTGAMRLRPVRRSAQSCRSPAEASAACTSAAT